MFFGEERHFGVIRSAGSVKEGSDLVLYIRHRFVLVDLGLILYADCVDPG
jgi:hypothetical protein